jgi:hypothetical protein
MVLVDERFAEALAHSEAFKPEELARKCAKHK